MIDHSQNEQDLDQVPACGCRTFSKKNVLTIASAVALLCIGLVFWKRGPALASADRAPTAPTAPHTTPPPPEIAEPPNLSVTPTSPKGSPKPKPTRGASAQSPTGKQIAARILKVTESRQCVFVKPAKQDPFASFDPPGLKLTLEAALPKGKMFATIDEPSDLEANDNTRADLTTIPERFGQKKHVDMGFQSEDKSGQFTLLLAQPSRGAATFNANVILPAQIFEGITMVSLAHTPEWQSLDTKSFGKAAKFRAHTDTRGNTSLEFSPESLHDRIQSVEFVDGGNQVPSTGSMWGMGTLSYSFGAGVTSAGTFNVTVRTGFENVQIVLDARGVDLP